MQVPVTKIILLVLSEFSFLKCLRKPQEMKHIVCFLSSYVKRNCIKNFIGKYFIIAVLQKDTEMFYKFS